MLLTDWIEKVSPSFPDQQSARYEARLLAEHITQRSSTQIRTHPYQLNKAQLQALDKLAARREQGAPIAYLIGWQPFYGLKLVVTPDTLIPRGDTEFVLDTALAQMQSTHAPVIADLGTGSGAIALALAQQRQDALLFAIDDSAAALDIAQRNAQYHQIANIEFVCADWMTALSDDCVDFIITNPPYIAENDPHLPDLQFEPRRALVAGDGGLAAIKSILHTAPRVLKTSGQLFIEHGYNQARALHQIATEQGMWRNIRSVKDYGGQPRLTMLTLKGDKDS